MILVLIFKPMMQLAHDRTSIMPIMNEHIVPLKRLYKGLRHTVALRTADRRTADSHVDAAGKGDGGMGKIVHTVIREPLNRLSMDTIFYEVSGHQVLRFMSF